jgi:hypothetical protein
MGKTVKKIKNFFPVFYLLHCFSADQSEAELLYFCSLFFSVKKPFQKTNIVFLLLLLFHIHNNKRQQQSAIKRGEQKAKQ